MQFLRSRYWYFFKNLPDANVINRDVAVAEDTVEIGMPDANYEDDEY